MKLLISLFLLCATTLSAQSKKVWRPFSDDSPWNQKIPVNTNLDKDSQSLIDDFASRGPLYINMKDWSIALYIIDSDSTEKHNVQDSRPGVYGKGFEFPRHIPIPKNAIASPPLNGDNHLCIIDTVKNIEWGMWWVRQDDSRQWFTGLGAVTDLSGSGVADPWFSSEREFDSHRARAGGFPLIAGLIRVEEIKAGKIEHALVFAYDNCRSEFFVAPASTAQATKDDIKNNFGIPMGGRIQLDPNWDVESSALSESGKIIARALQEYGAYCGDFAGANVIYAENSPEALTEWSGILNPEELYNVLTPEMISKHFRVINMNVLPGQNFNEKPPYIISFTFQDQIVNSKIDYFENTVEIIVSEKTDIRNLIAEFEAEKKNTKVFIKNVEQLSGKTINDFSSRQVYTLVTNEGTTKDWQIIVKKK